MKKMYFLFVLLFPFMLYAQQYDEALRIKNIPLNLPMDEFVNMMSSIGFTTSSQTNAEVVMEGTLLHRPSKLIITPKKTGDEIG